MREDSQQQGSQKQGGEGAGRLGLDADLDEAALLAAYNPKLTVSDAEFEAVIDRYLSASQHAARTCRHRADIVFDAQSGQTFDLFAAGEGVRAPAFMFIHGGYWRGLSKHHSAFMAPMLAARGIATVAVDHQLSPSATLPEIVRQIRAACAHLWKNAEDLGIDRNRIFVGGSSAGGHLAAMLVAGGWQSAFDLPEAPVAGLFAISGLFDLTPIARTFPQQWLNLSPADVVAMSPLAHLPRQGPPSVVAHARHEPAGFLRQSAAWRRAWREAGFDARLLEIDDRNHFDIILDLMDEGSEMTRALLSLIENGGV